MEHYIDFRFLNIFEDVSIVPSSENEPKIVMSQPVIHFLVPFIPTQLSFSIVAGVSGFLPGWRYELEVVLINEIKNEEILSLPWVINQEDSSEGLPPAGVFATNVKNLIIDNEGRFRLNLINDGEILGSTYFEVYKKERVISNAGH